MISFQVSFNIQTLIYAPVGSVADIVIVGVNWYIFSLESFHFKVRQGMRALLYIGSSGGICTLVADIVFWASYKTFAPDRSLHLLGLTSAVVRLYLNSKDLS